MARGSTTAAIQRTRDGEADDSQQVSVYYHRIGTPQAEDTHVYSITDHETRNPYAEVTDDGRYLIVGVFDGYDSNGVYYQELGKPDTPVVKLLDEWDALYDLLGNKDDIFYFSTTHDAPKYRIVAVDLKNPAPDNWQEVVPEAEETIEGASLAGGHLIVQYLKDARSLVKVFDLEGQQTREVELPGIGSVGDFDGKFDDPETFYSFTGYTTPDRIYHYDIESGESTLFREAKVNVDLSPFVTTQVFYESKDGTRVPMFIVHREDLELDGTNPTLLYGYGGFNVSRTPLLQPTTDRLDGDGWRAGRRQPARRRRVRRGVAPGRHQAAKAERLRRLHRRCRVADRQRLHVARASWRFAAARTADYSSAPS